MLDLMILQDNPIFPEESETENAEKVMMDFRSPSATFSPSESNVELLAVREKMAAVQKDIDSKEKKIDGQEQLIKSQQKEIEALKESLASANRSQQQEVETLKESLASAIRSQQQEVETLKESQASEIRVLMANHAEEIARTKTKVWVRNNSLICFDLSVNF
jgi:chromosome segregation ATPase